MRVDSLMDKGLFEQALPHLEEQNIALGTKPSLHKLKVLDKMSMAYHFLTYDDLALIKKEEAVSMAKELNLEKSDPSYDRNLKKSLEFFQTMQFWYLLKGYQTPKEAIDAYLRIRYEKMEVQDLLIEGMTISRNQTISLKFSCKSKNRKIFVNKLMNFEFVDDKFRIKNVSTVAR